MWPSTPLPSSKSHSHPFGNLPSLSQHTESSPLVAPVKTAALWIIPLPTLCGYVLPLARAGRYTLSSRHNVVNLSGTRMLMGPAESFELVSTESLLALKLAARCCMFLQWLQTRHTSPHPHSPRVGSSWEPQCPQLHLNEVLGMNLFHPSCTLTGDSWGVPGHPKGPCVSLPPSLTLHP